MTSPESNPLDDLERFHADVDAAAALVAEQHGERLTCHRGCSACCVDELTVFSVEAERIRQAAGPLLAEGLPHAEGQCAFLDEEGACRVYDARPYVCRTQGLPLRWTDEDDQGIVEYRDICELNDEGPALEVLPTDALFTLGPNEARLRQIQLRFASTLIPRIALRELFTSGNESEVRTARPKKELP